MPQEISLLEVGWYRPLRVPAAKGDIFMSQELAPRIVTPELSHATGILAVRKAVYFEELMTAGVSPRAATAHVRQWGSEESIQNYQACMAEWLTHPEEIYYRTVLLGREVAGWCIGERANDLVAFNYLKVIQLAPAVRRQGVGSRLLQEFAQTIANPQYPTRLNVLKGNEPAIAFYHTLGFKETGVQDEWYYTGEKTEVLGMEKPPQFYEKETV